MKRPWQDFANVASQTSVHGARAVTPADLVDMSAYRKSDALRCVLAYAQEELIYNDAGDIAVADAETYKATPRERRLNIFGLSYRREAKFWLHKILADIVVGAAAHLHQTQGWTTVLYDGLRTVEGTYKLYCFASDKDMADGLLALPGQSAHNKGLAVDSMMYDAAGREVDMGGHFDHLNMETNSRAYTGNKISAAAKKNRIIREAAFLRSAFSQGLLIAPLRNEFWDDRPPENRADLWRVLDSAARCLGVAPSLENRERWSYADFLAKWQETFKGREKEIEALIGSPPKEEKPEFYHGNFHPIYDRYLKASGKHLTE